MKLVIVESPAKSKTIHKYLGRDYTVKASVGHVRDLPKSNKNAIDIAHGFVPHYEISKGAHKNIKGYEFYSQMGQAAAAAGHDAVTENFISFQVAGTPQTCLEKINFIKSKVHMNQFVAVFKYGGMPIEVAEDNMRRFAATVMPALQRDETHLNGRTSSIAAAD